MTQGSTKLTVFRRRADSAVFEAVRFDGRDIVARPGRLERDVVVSPVLEPTEQNPGGVYGQVRGGGTCVPGDWIVFDAEGGVWVLKADVFADAYERLDSGRGDVADLLAAVGEYLRVVDLVGEDEELSGERRTAVAQSMAQSIEGMRRVSLAVPPGSLVDLRRQVDKVLRRPVGAFRTSVGLEIVDDLREAWIAVGGRAEGDSGSRSGRVPFRLEDVFAGRVELTAMEYAYAESALTESYMRGGVPVLEGETPHEFHRRVFGRLLGPLLAGSRSRRRIMGRKDLEDLFAGHVELTASERAYALRALYESYDRGGAPVPEGENLRGFYQRVAKRFLGSLRLERMVTPDGQRLVTVEEHKRIATEILSAKRDDQVGRAKIIAERRDEHAQVARAEIAEAGAAPDQACPACGGDGFFKGPRLGDEPCPRCKGEGRVAAGSAADLCAALRATSRPDSSRIAEAIERSASMPGDRQLLASVASSWPFALSDLCFSQDRARQLIAWVLWGGEFGPSAVAPVEEEPHRRLIAIAYAIEAARASCAEGVDLDPRHRQVLQGAVVGCADSVEVRWAIDALLGICDRGLRLASCAHYADWARGEIHRLLPLLAAVERWRDADLPPDPGLDTIAAALDAYRGLPDAGLLPDEVRRIVEGGRLVDLSVVLRAALAEIDGGVAMSPGLRGDLREAAHAATVLLFAIERRRVATLAASADPRSKGEDLGEAEEAAADEPRDGAVVPETEIEADDGQQGKEEAARETEDALRSYVACESRVLLSGLALLRSEMDSQRAGKPVPAEIDDPKARSAAWPDWWSQAREVDSKSYADGVRALLLGEVTAEQREDLRLISFVYQGSTMTSDSVVIARAIDDGMAEVDAAELRVEVARVAGVESWRSVLERWLVSDAAGRIDRQYLATVTLGDQTWMSCLRKCAQRFDSDPFWISVSTALRSLESGGELCHGVRQHLESFAFGSSDPASKSLVATDVSAMLSMIDARSAEEGGSSQVARRGVVTITEDQRSRLDALAAVVVPAGIDEGGIGALRGALRSLDDGVGLDASSRVGLQRWIDAELLYGYGAAGDDLDTDAIRALVELLDVREALMEVANELSRRNRNWPGARPDWIDAGIRALDRGVWPRCDSWMRSYLSLMLTDSGCPVIDQVSRGREAIEALIALPVGPLWKDEDSSVPPTTERAAPAGESKVGEVEARAIAGFICAEIQPSLGRPSRAQEVDVDGRRDSRDLGIRYLGKALLQPDGEYHVLADVHGSLCRVAIRITPEDRAKTKEADPDGVTA